MKLRKTDIQCSYLDLLRKMLSFGRVLNCILTLGLKPSLKLAQAATKQQLKPI